MRVYVRVSECVRGHSEQKKYSFEKDSAHHVVSLTSWVVRYEVHQQLFVYIYFLTYSGFNYPE